MEEQVLSWELVLLSLGIAATIGIAIVSAAWVLFRGWIDAHVKNVAGEAAGDAVRTQINGKLVGVQNGIDRHQDYVEKQFHQLSGLIQSAVNRLEADLERGSNRFHSQGEAIVELRTRIEATEKAVLG